MIGRYPYIKQYYDSYGKLRRYFNRRGYPSAPLPGKPGSPEFMQAYHAALAQCRVEPERRTLKLGTVSAVVAAYYVSQDFAAFAPGTRAMRRAILERFRTQHGDKSLAQMQRRHVLQILATLKPFASRNWLKTLRGLMAFAVAAEIIRDDPTAGIKPVRAREGRIHTWTEDEIAQFEAFYPIGTRPRLAMALLLYTAQRRGDAVHVGPQHVRDGWIAYTQQKTGVRLRIPIHPRLAEVLAATPMDTGAPDGVVRLPTSIAFITTDKRRKFSAAGFGNVMREWCDAAGLPECSSHGLRKAACVRLAEVGSSAPEIAAISGHKSLREVQRYIEEANQAKLAKAAMERMGGRTNQNRPCF
jgi:integrase